MSEHQDFGTVKLASTMEGDGHDAPAGEPITAPGSNSNIEQDALVAGVATENGPSSTAERAETARPSSGPAEAGGVGIALPSGSSTEAGGIGMANLSGGPTPDEVTDQHAIDLETAVDMESAEWAKMVRDQKTAHQDLSSEDEVMMLQTGPSDAMLNTADDNKDSAAIESRSSDQDGVDQGGVNDGTARVSPADEPRGLRYRLSNPSYKRLIEQNIMGKEVTGSVTQLKDQLDKIEGLLTASPLTELKKQLDRIEVILTTLSDTQFKEMLDGMEKLLSNKPAFQIKEQLDKLEILWQHHPVNAPVKYQLDKIEKLLRDRTSTTQVSEHLHSAIVKLSTDLQMLRARRPDPRNSASKASSAGGAEGAGSAGASANAPLAGDEEKGANKRPRLFTWDGHASSPAHAQADVTMSEAVEDPSRVAPASAVDSIQKM